MVGTMRSGLAWLLSSLVVSQVQAFYIPGKSTPSKTNWPFPLVGKEAQPLTMLSDIYLVQDGPSKVTKRANISH
jgi:hypothetical protein